MFKNLVTATETLNYDDTSSDEMMSVSTETLNTLLANMSDSDAQADAYFGLKSDLMSAKNLLSVLSETSDPTSVLAVANGAGDIVEISPAYESFLNNSTALSSGVVSNEIKEAIATGLAVLAGYWKTIWKAFSFLGTWKAWMARTWAAFMQLNIHVALWRKVGVAAGGGPLLASVATPVAPIAAGIMVAVAVVGLGIWAAKLYKNSKPEAKALAKKIEANMKRAGEQADKAIDVNSAKELLIASDVCIEVSDDVSKLLEMSLPTSASTAKSFKSSLRSFAKSNAMLNIVEEDGKFTSGSNTKYLETPKNSGNMKKLGYDKRIGDVISKAVELSDAMEKIKKTNSNMGKHDKDLEAVLKKMGADNDISDEDKAIITEAHASYKSLIATTVSNAGKLLAETARQSTKVISTWTMKIAD